MDKKVTIGVIAAAVILIGGGVYFYSTKPAATPVQNTQTQNPQENISPGITTLNVVQAESHATYEINEQLQGTPTHVKGETNAITGTITIDSNLPNTITLSPIKIDANTFKTDVAQRDANVRKLILKSDQPANQYITFTTTKITGVPETIEGGKEFPVEITGNIFVSGVTKEVTFKGHASWASDNTFNLHAENTLTYGDFGLQIPNFSFLSNVDKAVKLTIHLVAR